MRYLVTFLLFLLALGTVQAQEFDRLHDKSVQPVLSQPLVWVSALTSAAPNLPEAFVAKPNSWAFSPYAHNAPIPTATGRDVWAKFTLAATLTPQSWVIRIPRVTVQKVSLYSMTGSKTWRADSAGNLIAPDAWNRNTRLPSFDVQTSAVEATYFLRFQHHSHITERPQLMSQLDFVEGTARIGTLTGLMFGMFGILIVMCIATNALSNNTEFLSLAAFAAAILLIHLVFNGYGGWQLWPGSAHLNQVMPCVTPLLVVAAGSWFFAQASYAKQTHVAVFRLLVFVAIANLVIVSVNVFAVTQINDRVLSAWAAICMTTLMLALLWMCVRGRRWNWWLLAGLIPIACVAFAWVAYNYGWLPHVEHMQVINVLLTQLGLLVLFLVLIWRSRSALLSSKLDNALDNTEAITGLTQERVARVRLQQMLMRANRLQLGCGVVMLRWLDSKQHISGLTTEQKNALLTQIGSVLRRTIRDIDTAAACKDDHFMILVEGPIGRHALSSLATQMISTFIRLSEKIDDPNAFNFHIAIWQAGLAPASKEEVLEALHTRLSQMSFGTKRTVQFVDAAVSDLPPQPDPESTKRRDDMVAKIDAIEASTNMRVLLKAKNLRH